MSSLSAVIICQNMAQSLSDCLESLRQSGSPITEIVVVDDESTDDSVAVARAHTPHVLVHPHSGDNWDLNKNVGMDHATGDWILLIDADECLEPEACKALTAWLQGDSDHAAYWLPRKEIYFGVHAHHGASDAQVLRLVRRGQARFEGDRLHANPRIAGTIGYLEAPLRHHAYETIAQYIKKTNQYTDHEARMRHARGDRTSWKRILAAPLRRFRYRFWVLKGYKDGMDGFIFALCTSLYPLLEELKLWELSQKEHPHP